MNTKDFLELPYQGLSWLETQGQKVRRLSRVDKLFSWFANGFCPKIPDKLEKQKTSE